MFSSKLKRPLLALAVTAGLLTAAGPASAVVTNNNDPEQATSPRPFSIDIGTSEALVGRAASLKSDSNEVAVESITLATGSRPKEATPLVDHDGSPTRRP